MRFRFNNWFYALEKSGLQNRNVDSTMDQDSKLEISFSFTAPNKKEEKKCDTE